jgi:hypothetical protein
MPVLYIHGVNTRSRQGFLALKPFLECRVAPAISNDPAGVRIEDVYWGDLAATFAWDGASRPRSRLLGQGADDSVSTLALLSSASNPALAEKLPARGGQRDSGGLISGSAGEAHVTVRLSGLSAEELSNYLSLLLRSIVPDDASRTALSLEADNLAHDPRFRAELSEAGSADAEKDLLLRRLQGSSGSLVGMGAPRWLGDLAERLDEGLRRASDLPSFAVATVAGEFRRPLNDLVSFFVGDVFVYLNTRGTPDAPGPIPQRLLSKLRELAAAPKRDGEPLVILSHSMGGQLVYDLITAFMPRDPQLAGLKIDFWCATASQVGFFEEMKLFLASRPEYRKGNPAPFPKNLGGWWNVWDYNDFISYTVRDIFEGADDGNFDSGMSLVEAHGGYLACPSFYRRLADKLTEFQRKNEPAT